MSPRYRPPALATSYPQREPVLDPPDVKAAEERAWRDAAGPGKCSYDHPDAQGCQHSFFADLLRAYDEQRRVSAGFEYWPPHVPEEQPSLANRDDPLQRAKQRLRTVYLEQRDLSGGTQADMLRPAAPRYLQETWGQAAAQVSSLIDAFERRPIEPGMVDIVGGVPTVKISRLLTGPATAVQSAENAGVQEVDATSGTASAPVATIAGQEDMSRQLLEFSQPGADEVLMDALGRDFGGKVDVQVLNGAASAGATRGLLTTAGILSVVGSVTNAETAAESIWKAYSQLAGSSGFGNPRPEDYVVILHPRRLAWLSGGSGSTALAVRPNLPGTLVPCGSMPTNLGAGTNEDPIIVCERSNVLLLGGQPQFKLYEDVGSGTQTVRISGWGYIAVLVRNPTAIAKISGMVAPAGF